MNGVNDANSDYEAAEHHYTKLTRRYIFSWSGIVCLYALVLLIVPVNDMLHGQVIANNWVTLFKLGFVEQMKPKKKKKRKKKKINKSQNLTLNVSQVSN